MCIRDRLSIITDQATDSADTVYLGILKDLSGIYEERSSMMRQYGIALACLLVIGGLAAFLLSRYLTRPIEQLNRTAGRIAGGDFEKRAVYQGTDEIGELSRSFNRMTDLSLIHIFGTLVGTASRAGMLDKDGKMPNMKQALLSDAVGTLAGSVTGTSTVTTFVESASGVEAGGRTGLTALTTGIMFLACIFIAPIAGIIPAAATSSALIYVGVLDVYKRQGRRHHYYGCTLCSQCYQEVQCQDL